MGVELGGLDSRSREVLASVVKAYIDSAVPVSSRQLSRSGSFGLSPASLRNAMADLEDLGFLTHPHVSAGRVPTDLGYRTFVTDLMQREPLSGMERARIAAQLDPESFDLDRFLHAASKVLSRLTGQVAVVAAPRPQLILQAFHFTRVSERRVLLIQVAEPGLVESRLIETKEDYPQDELDAVSRMLTVDYAGRSLVEIQKLLVQTLAEEKVRVDEALARAMELAKRAFLPLEPARDEGAVFVEGTETILEKPEFQTDVEGLKKLFHAFDDRVRLVNLLSDCLAGREVAVVIGSESALTGETQSSVVSAAFHAGDRTLGALGVIGPRRMPYSRIVPIVEELGRYVTRRLTEGAS